MSKAFPELDAYARYLPELRSVDDPAIAHQALNATRWSAPVMVEACAVLIALVIATMLLGVLVQLLFGHLDLGFSVFGIWAAVIGIGTALLPILLTRVTARARRRKLQQWLWAHGYPVCTGCGKSLVDESGACPTCGTVCVSDRTV
jgi:hypothetical protein